jgi:hypothetical protein
LKTASLSYCLETDALRLSGVVKRRQGQEEKRKSTDASSHYPYNVDE